MTASCRTLSVPRFPFEFPVTPVVQARDCPSWRSARRTAPETPRWSGLRSARSLCASDLLQSCQLLLDRGRFLVRPPAFRRRLRDELVPRGDLRLAARELVLEPDEDREGRVGPPP